MDIWCYLNGEILFLEEARVAINDRGALYGDGLFETLRIYEGQPFLLESHLKRMQEGARTLGMNMPFSPTEVERAVNGIIARNEVKEGSLRITLTRGVGLRGLWPGEEEGQLPTFFITTASSLPYEEHHYQKGMSAALVSFPLNEYSPQAGLKTLNFLDYIMGRREAQERGFDEGIFLNQKRYLAEGSVSNLFLIQEGVLLTPPLEAGILPGITREVVLKLASSFMEVREENISPLQLKKADELFLTNSLMEIMPMVQVEGQQVASGRPGPITSRLHRLYSEYVKENCNYSGILEKE